MTEKAAYLLALGFGVSMLIGYFLIVVVSSGRISSKLSWALALPVGTGVGSFTFFFFRRPLVTVDVLLLVALALMWWRKRKRSSEKTRGASTNTPLALWLIAALSWVTFASFVWVDKGPHGDWDGWAIWNAHSRYLYRAGPVWKQHIINSEHPDYPLLLPAATARLWRYVGKDIPEISGIQEVLIAVSGVLILAAALWELRAGFMSFIAPLFLLGTPFYLYMAVAQYAEVPLAIYILSTLALICVDGECAGGDGRLLVLAGFMAGCAAWTKNEGLLFVVAVSLGLLVPIFRSPSKTLRRLTMFAIGLLLPLAVTFYFKFTVPPPNQIVSNRGFAEVLAKVLDYSRYTTIGSAFLTGVFTFGKWAIHPVLPLIVCLGIWGVDRRIIRSSAWITSVCVVLVVLAGYSAVYVITPLGLDYHIATSLPRLLLHVWPAVLLLAGSAVSRTTQTTIRSTTRSGP